MFHTFQTMVLLSEDLRRPPHAVPEHHLYPHPPQPRPSQQEAGEIVSLATGTFSSAEGQKLPGDRGER